MRKPVVYQEDAKGVRHPVEGHYVVNSADKTVQVALANHDASQRLVIDPQLILYDEPRSIGIRRMGRRR